MPRRFVRSVVDWLGPPPALPRPVSLDADRRAAVALWSSALLLVVLLYRGGFPNVTDVLPALGAVAETSLVAQLYWVFWGFLCYLIVPVGICLLVFRESPARYGLRIHVSKRHALVYATLFVGMLPVVLLASTSASFVNKYPLVSDLGVDASRLALWEVARGLRFVALEFFFRGYLLFALEERLGHHAIAVSALPYAIVHLGKPFPEALGAIIAGGILGFLALRSRSVFGGILVHVGVATAMDLVALAQKGYFG